MSDIATVDATLTPRLKASPWQLLRQALGSPELAAAKLERLLEGLRAYADTAELDARLWRLFQKGIVEEIPSRVQLVIGGIDMLRFWISPAAADYYERRGINFAFHQLLRLLDDPRSMMNPVGLLNSRDGIIGHLMQVVHANPDYDLQLLEMFEDGLEALERELEEMLAGTHPRAASISAIVEEPDYHGRLLAYVRAWQRGQPLPPMLRENVEKNLAFRELERTFGTLTNSMRYFRRLPSSPLGGVIHLLRVKDFPRRFAALDEDVRRGATALLQQSA
jgi:hypothetical protein